MRAASIKRAHIYGIWMGGGIVQEVALNYPDRVMSLVINCSLAKMDRYGARVTENIMNVWRQVNFGLFSAQFAAEGFDDYISKEGKTHPDENRGYWIESRDESDCSSQRGRSPNIPRY